jgi:hypothetical protein
MREEVDDSGLGLGVVLGLRQPLFRDKLRVIVSGRGDLARQETATLFDTSTEQDETTLSSAQYAIGLEGVLANVTLDLAWVFGEEIALTPPDLGSPPDRGARSSWTGSSLRGGGLVGRLLLLATAALATACGEETPAATSSARLSPRP